MRSKGYILSNPTRQAARRRGRLVVSVAHLAAVPKTTGSIPGRLRFFPVTPPSPPSCKWVQGSPWKLKSVGRSADHIVPLFAAVMYLKFANNVSPRYAETGVFTQ